MWVCAQHGVLRGAPGCFPAAQGLSLMVFVAQSQALLILLAKDPSLGWRLFSVVVSCLPLERQ